MVLDRGFGSPKPGETVGPKQMPAWDARHHAMFLEMLHDQRLEYEKVLFASNPDPWFQSDLSHMESGNRSIWDTNQHF